MSKDNSNLVLLDDGASISISNNEKLFIPNTITKVPTSSQINTVGVGKSDKHKINVFGIIEFPILTSKGHTVNILVHSRFCARIRLVRTNVIKRLWMRILHIHGHEH